MGSIEWTSMGIDTFGFEDRLSLLLGCQLHFLQKHLSYTLKISVPVEIDMETAESTVTENLRLRLNIGAPGWLGCVFAFGLGHDPRDPGLSPT